MKWHSRELVFFSIPLKVAAIMLILDGLTASPIVRGVVKSYGLKLGSHYHLISNLIRPKNNNLTLDPFGLIIPTQSQRLTKY